MSRRLNKCGFMVIKVVGYDLLDTLIVKLSGQMMGGSKRHQACMSCMILHFSRPSHDDTSTPKDGDFIVMARAFHGLATPNLPTFAATRHLDLCVLFMLPDGFKGVVSRSGTTLNAPSHDDKSRWF